MSLPGVVLKIAGESASAVRAIEQTESALGGVGKAGSGAGDKLRAMQGPALAALAGISAGALVAVDAASKLEQSTGAVAAVFGEQTAAMEKAAEAANTLGLSTADYNDQAALLGALLKNTGTESAALAAETETLISLSADMAAQFGGSTNDAVGAISSALKGSYEVLDNYGVKMTAADVSARAAADGTTQAQAAVALLTEQLADTGTIGAAERELDTVASTTARARAQMEDAAAEIGTALLPAVAGLTDHLADMAGWVEDNSDLVLAITGAVAAFAAVIVTLNAVMKVYTLIQAAANITLLGFPLTWIVVAIVAVIAAVVLLWKNWDKVTAFMSKAWDKVVSALRTAVDSIKGFFSGLWDSVSGFVNRIIDKINAMISAFNKLPGPDIPTIPTSRTASGSSTRLARTAAGYTPAAASGAGITINVSAGISDPAAVAREIRRVLAYDAVRVGIR